MDLSLYTLNKRVNSTARPAGEGTVYSGKLREGCDTLSPVIGLNLGHNTSPSAYNYAYIATFGRFYWIQNWRWEAGLWWCECKVDALATWRDYILGSTQYVLRTSDTTHWDGSILDVRYPAKTSATETTVSFSPPWNITQNFTSGAFVVGIANRASNALGGTSYYAMSSSEFRGLIRTLLDDASWTGFADGDSDLTESVYKSLFNPLQYISSCMWFPFQVPSAGYEALSFGWWTTSLTASPLTTTCSVASRTLQVPHHPAAANRGQYLDVSPYSRWSLDNGPFGIAALNPALYVGHDTILLNYTFDFISGKADCRIGPGGSGTALYPFPELTQSIQLGVPIQIHQIASNVMGVLQGAVSAAGSAVSIATGNVGGGLTGTASGILNAIDAMLPQVSSRGSNGAMSAFMWNPSFTAYFFDVADEDRANLGRPLCSPLMLSALAAGSYVMIAEPDISLPATEAEIDEIRGYMASGMFLDRPGE